jgi:flagellar basal-body rod protein FlgF
MSDGIYSALSGALAQERNLQVVANNVANVNTTGYKGDKTIFAEVLNKAKTNLPIAPSLRYAAVNQLAVNRETGSLKVTGRPLDVGIQGDAYFVVQTAHGERYTRAGEFVMDQQGVVRTPGGLEVLQAQGHNIAQPGRPIKIPPLTKEIQIMQDGQINVDGTPLAKLKLVHFNGPNDLLREGLTLFSTQAGVKPTPVPPTATVEQGYLESANVNAVSGLNELITLNRSFEALEKVIDTFRDLDNRTVRDVSGKV